MKHRKTDIDRYLAEGLSPGEETRLREHLRACQDCRTYYDRQVILLRALSGNPQSPTPQELDRQVGLAFKAAGLAQPPKPLAKEPGWLDRLRWIRIPQLAGAALLVVLLAASYWYFLADISKEPTAQLIKAVATTVDDDPVDLETSHRSAVFDRQRIEVGPNGIAEFELQQGGTVRVYPDTVLVLKGPGRRLDLGHGKIWCLVEPSGEPFLVRTDLAAVRVTGTSFVVERTKQGQTHVRVMEGQVEVRQLKKQKTLLVDGGWQTRVVLGQSPETPSRYRPVSDRSEWDRKVDELWRDIKRAFGKVKNFFEGR